MNKILHTSDWHLGQRLEGQERAAEQQAFLNWLLGEIERRGVDALLVCGDIFDVANPPIDAVRMLYGFLAEVRRLCPNVVLTAGNHDSGARLDAMGTLATELGISIIGSLPANLVHCILPLVDAAGKCFARVAAVPYLRAGDLAAAAEDEDVAAQHGRLMNAISARYRELLEAANSVLQPDEALVVTGHLFARGGTVGEGERAAHVEAGSLLAVPGDVFGEGADYVALGHLHRSQRVAKKPPVWYSGTPLPLTFGHAEGEQSVLLVSIQDGAVESVEPIVVPRTHELYDVVGERGVVLARLAELSSRHPAGSAPAWLRVTVLEEEPDPGIRDVVTEALAGSNLHLIAVRLRGAGEGGSLADQEPEQRLDELAPERVFEIFHQERYGSLPDASLVDAFAELLQAVLTAEEAT